MRGNRQRNWSSSNPSEGSQVAGRSSRGSRDTRTSGRSSNRANWSDGRRAGGENVRSGQRSSSRSDFRNRSRDNRGNWADNRRGGRDSWRDNRRGGRDNLRNNQRGQRAAYRQGVRDGARWDRGWRNNNRYNWSGFRQSNRLLFRPGPYFAPFSGHFYRPVGVGFFLDPLFFQPRFFLNDPWAFRLPPPGARFRWVRYYDDVLLVDVFTGEVVDVIQNFFW